MITKIDTDVPHIVKMKIMFVEKIQYWKVLNDTGAHCKDECNTSFSSPIQSQMRKMLHQSRLLTETPTLHMKHLEVFFLEKC